MYVKYCSKVEGAWDPRCEQCGAAEEKFVEQRRLVCLPNVLVVQVRRAVPGGAVCRTRVQAEEQFSVPGSSVPMELWGVVYHQGERAESGHYRAACRGPD